MKKVNNFTVYEQDDPCALDEYSEQLAEELNTEFGKKVNTKDGYNLMSNEEREKLAGLNNYDDTALKREILNLQSQNTKLKANQIYGTATGTEIEIPDSAEIEVSVKVGGESVQEAEPTPDSPSEIKNLTGNVECKVRGENILDLSKFILTHCILQENGTIKSDINNYYFCNATTTELNKFLLEHKGDTITFSIDKPIQDKSLTIVIYGTRTSGLTYQEAVTGRGVRSVSITIANDFTQITSLQLRWNRDSSAFSDTTTVIKDLMLCLGEGTVYEPYKEKSVTFPFLEGQALRKDGYLAEDGIHNVKNQSAINITGIVTLSNGNVGGVCYLTNKINKGNNYLLCSNAVFDKGLTGLTKEEGTVYENAGNVVLLGNSTDTLETIKAKYDGGTIEYELAEPTTTPYTEEQQEAYNQLQNLILFKGYNYIEITAENGVKANLEVNYIKSTEIYAKSLEERIQALENAVLS